MVLVMMRARYLTARDNAAACSIAAKKRWHRSSTNIIREKTRSILRPFFWSNVDDLASSKCATSVQTPVSPVSDRSGAKLWRGLKGALASRTYLTALKQDI